MYVNAPNIAVGKSTTSSGVEVLTTWNWAAMPIQSRMISAHKGWKFPVAATPTPIRVTMATEQASFQPAEAAAGCAAHGATLAPTSLPFVEPNTCSMRSLSASACVRRACGW